MLLKSLTAFSLVLSTSLINFASAQAPEYELQCRIQAKEVAAKTYTGCVKQARSTQIEQLKKDYQERLKSMKQEYESELKRLAHGKSTGKASKMSRAQRNNNAASSARMDDMQIESRSQMSLPDESVMEIPEPMPIEDVPTVQN